MPALQISEPVGGWARLDTRALLESDSKEILSTPPARGGDILLGYLEAMLADGQKESKHIRIIFAFPLLILTPALTVIKIMLNEEIYIGREASWYVPCRCVHVPS